MAELTVRCSWQPAGPVVLARGMLVFPKVPDAAGIYRFTLNDEAGARVYVGESMRLRGRFQHYRTPGGPGERRTTKFRLNQLMRETLAAGGHITAEIALQAKEVAIDGTAAALDLGVMTDRRRAESAALAEARSAGWVVLNR